MEINGALSIGRIIERVEIRSQDSVRRLLHQVRQKQERLEFMTICGNEKRRATIRNEMLQKQEIERNKSRWK